MMRPAVVWMVVVLASASCRYVQETAATHMLEGSAWRSDEARTWASLRTVADKLSPRQKELWLSPGFFGRMYLVFRDKQVMSVYDGECIDVADYVVPSPSASAVEIHTKDRKSGQEGTFELVGATLRTRTGNGKLPRLDPAREVFVPFPIEDAERQFPCLKVRAR